MDLRRLLFSSQGRIPRSTWWIFRLASGGIALVLFIVLIILSNLFSNSFSENALAGIGWVTICIFAPLYLFWIFTEIMVSIKRCHDRNRSGWFLLWGFVPSILYFIFTLALLPAQYTTFGYGSSTADAAVALTCVLNLIIFGIGLWFLIELGFLRGTVGPNKYGPDPLQVGTSGVSPYTPPPGGGSQYTPPPVQLTGELPGEVLHPGGVKVCPFCGEVSLQDAIFCKSCGKELPADSSE